MSELKAYNTFNSNEELDENILDKHFKIMSWNIDGLDKNNLESRTRGVIETIQK